MNKNIYISVGEPAGIGPDIVLKTLSEFYLNNFKKLKLKFKIKIFANVDMMTARAELLNINFDPLYGLPDLTWENVPLSVETVPGVLNIKNSAYVLACLKKAADACLENLDINSNINSNILLTGPVHKGIIQQAGFDFSGHTEFLKAHAGVDHVVMLMHASNQNLNIALLTTHIPLVKISENLTFELFEKTFSVISIFFKNKNKNKNKNKKIKIGVCGLNPHAGESGCLGREEIEKIQPWIEIIKTKQLFNNLEILGPLPGDSIFSKQVRETLKLDLILALYHDQGLAPFKALCFEEGLNITLGLPYERISVDHGVALSLAGTGRANYKNFEHVLAASIA